jgi:hypothetical protein
MTVGPGRRAFLTGAGAVAATLAVSAPADAEPGPPAGGTPAGPAGSGGSPADEALTRHAYQVRVQAARQQASVAVPAHPNNGDEKRYPNKIGSDTRGLPHDRRGEVDPAAWAVAERAFASRRWEDFERIPLGGTRKLLNPLGTLAVSLEGTTPAQVGIVPAPTVAGRERAAEATENYWQALLRDVPFAEYQEHEAARAAAAELDRLPGYAGPRVRGKVTPEVLFRGSVLYPADEPRRARSVVPPGVLAGPYLSQFPFLPVPYGTQSVAAGHRLARPGQDFLTDYDSWLAVQNGIAPTATTILDPGPRQLRTGRDLAEYAHGASPLFWGAALQLAAPAGGAADSPTGIGAPFSPTNPYRRSVTQSSANASFALGHLQALLAVGASRTVRAAYWQKWFVHRSVRPEAFGGLVHHRTSGDADHPIHRDFLDSQGLARNIDRFGSALLPQAYPEGAPLHGSYPAGSAAIAGVSATLLKAFFDESHVIGNPVVADPADATRLVRYDGPALTVGGELNKLAVNYTFGRVIAGIHWRSDAAAGLALGEQVAIAILRDERRTLAEPFEGFRFTRFDGTTVTI